MRTSSQGLSGQKTFARSIAHRACHGWPIRNDINFDSRQWKQVCGHFVEQKNKPTIYDRTAISANRKINYTVTPDT